MLQAEPGQVSDPNISSFSPLHCALVSGNEQCGHLLLSHSASVSCQDSQGFTVLHIAAATNLLLAKGAEVNARDFRQRTPLMLAAGRGHVNMLEVLMAAKADSELEDGDSNTALHLACSEGHIACVRFLIETCNVDIQVRDRWGNTPMEEAKKSNNMKVIAVLKKHMLNRQIPSEEPISEEVEKTELIQGRGS